MPQNTTSSDGFVPNDGFVPDAKPPDEFGTGFAKTNPVSLISGLAQAVANPVGVPSEVAQGLIAKGADFLQALKRHDWKEAAASFLELNPATGLVEAVGVPLAEGRPMEAAGAAGGLALTAGLGELVPPVARTVGRAATRVSEASSLPQVAKGAAQVVGAGASRAVLPWPLPYQIAKKGLANMREGWAKAAATDAVAADAQLLNDVAQSPAGYGKPYDKLSAEQQANVRNTAEAIKRGPAEQPRPQPRAARGPVYQPPAEEQFSASQIAPEPEPAQPLPVSRQIAAPPRVLVTPPPEDTSYVHAVPAQVAEKVPRGTTTTTVGEPTPEELAAPFKVEPRAPIETEARRRATAAQMESVRRANKVEAAGKLLTDRGVTPGDLEPLMNAPEDSPFWESLREHTSRVTGSKHEPFSPKSRALVLEELRLIQLEKPAFSLGRMKQYNIPIR